MSIKERLSHSLQAMEKIVFDIEIENQDKFPKGENEKFLVIPADSMTKLSTQLEGMRETVAGMPNGEKQSSGFLSGIPGFRSKKPIQVFMPQHTSKGLAVALEKMCTDMSYKYEQVGHVDLLQKDLPLVVVCPISSRLEPDIDQALQRIKWTSRFAVLVLHYGTENVVQSLPTTTLLSDTERYRPAMFIDAAFTEELKLYKCKKNEEAKERIKAFVDSFYKNK